MFSKDAMKAINMNGKLDSYVVEWNRGFVFPVDTVSFISEANHYVYGIASQRGWYGADVRVESYKGRLYGVITYADDCINGRKDSDPANATPLCAALKKLSVRMDILDSLVNIKHFRAAERVGDDDEPLTLVEQKRVIQQAIASFGSEVLKPEVARVLLGIVNPLMLTAVVNTARKSGNYHTTGELQVPRAGSIFAELSRLCDEILA